MAIRGVVGPRGRWRWGIEAGLWAALTALVALEMSSLSSLWDGYPLAEGTGMALLLAVALGVSRRWPHTALALVTTAMVVQGIAPTFGLDRPFLMSTTLPVVVLSFLAGFRSERTRPTVAITAAACAAVLPQFVFQGVTNGDLRETLSGAVNWAGAILILLLVVIAPWLFGRYWRRHAELLASGWEIAERMELARSADAERARLRERARIATEMHDSLGHDLTLIAVRAAALEMTAGDEAGRTTAGELRAATHEATQRLREIIGVLREDTAPPSGEPTGEGIAAVVERAVRAGMAVRLLREGPDPDPATPTGRAAHRVIQEALTNAAKHAPGTEVTVQILRAAGETTVRVTNTCPSATEPVVPASGNGSGLAGLRAHVEGMGGTFHAGPAEGPDTGFAVTALLSDAAAEPDAADTDAHSETAIRRSQASARARRRLVTAFAVPLGAAAVVTAAGFLVQWYVGTNEVLPAGTYAELGIGDDQAAVERLLPRFEYNSSSIEELKLAERPPVPPGASCRYYLTAYYNGLPPVYRLCFAEGQLVSKDEIDRRE